MEIFYCNNTKIKYNVDLILESLKSKINSIINNFCEEAYFKIKTKNDLYNWKNEIINLINKEIDKLKPDLQQLNNDLNQQEYIESEEHNVQNTRFGSQKEKCLILNKNIQLNDDKSYPFNNQNEKLFDDKSILNNNQNKKSTNNNFNKESNQYKEKNRHDIFIKFKQSNNRNVNQNEQNNQDKKLDFFTSKDIQEENKEITRTFQKEA